MSEAKAVKAAVLAAGMGKRISSDGSGAPKVMRLAAGRPLLAYVLEALDFLAPADIIVVVGYMRERVMEAFPEYRFAVQERQLGTGHAVMSAFETLGDYDGDLLVCCGDMPLLLRETYEALLEVHREAGADCTILSGSSSLSLPYGRIYRTPDSAFSGIIEEKDCTPEQLLIDELNSGVYLFDAAALRRVLSGLGSDNAQGEYYLTDAPALIKERGGCVAVCRRELGTQIVGVNTPEQLAEVESIIRERELRAGI